MKWLKAHTEESYDSKTIKDSVQIINLDHVVRLYCANREISMVNGDYIKLSSGSWTRLLEEVEKGYL